MAGLLAASCSPRCLQPSPLASFSLTLRPVSIPISRASSSLGLVLRLPSCRAAKQQQQQQQPPPAKKRGGKRRPPAEKPAPVDAVVELGPSPGGGAGRQSHPSPIPKPPAGFVLDPHGKVLLASDKRIATIFDDTNNLPLECVIRRVFESSRGDECMLLCPVDTPVQILKSSNFNGWSAVNDEEIEGFVILQEEDFAIPKKTYLNSAQLYKFMTEGFSADDVLLLLGTSGDLGLNQTQDDGEEIDGLPTEGVEITCFNLDGAHYMIYTPSDPLLFVAVRDKDGLLQIADDDLLEDPAIIGAIDEETEFNALVEEEAALLESLLGKDDL